MKKAIGIIVFVFIFLNSLVYAQWGRNRAPWGREVAFATKPAFRLSWKTDNVGTSNDDQITLPLVSSGAIDFIVDWGDGVSDNITAWDDAAKTHTYVSAGTYNVVITGTLKGWKFNDSGDEEKLLTISEWGVFDISENNGFNGCANLVISATDAPTISATDLTSFFRSCTKLTSIGDAAGWDVSSVTTMERMFYNTKFNQDIGSWDVSSVMDMDYMFSYASTFNQDINLWDVSKVTTMSSMFNNSAAFNKSLADWNLSAITTLANMFANSPGLTTANYNATLISWEGKAHQSNIVFHGGGSKFTGGEVDSGITDGDASDKLIQSGQNFLSTVSVGDVVYNTTDSAWARVANVDSDTQLTLDTDIMDTAEAYEIYNSVAAKAKGALIIDDGWTITDGGNE